ncbi:MAG: hypothetical protein KDB61_00100 [Planctomycetes bacterium]|nr:hypothetical protein [Planctomycetota bacterium]
MISPPLHRTFPKRRGMVATTCIAVISVVGVLMLSWFGGQGRRSEELLAVEQDIVAHQVADAALSLAEVVIWGRNPQDSEALGQRLHELGLDDSDGQPASLIKRLGLVQDATGAYLLANGIVHRLEVKRVDSADTHGLEITAVASMGAEGPQRTVRRTYDGAVRKKAE